jgi:AcrR family transcriptional regulator
MSPKVVDKEEKKREIVMAAMQVFSEKGVVNTKMIDIAQAAGIGKGTIYEYFKNKDDIFINLYQIHFSEITNEIASVLDKFDDPLTKMKQFISLTITSIIDEHSNFAEIMLDVWAEGIRTHNENINKVINLDEIYDQYRVLIIKILQEGIDKKIFKPMNTTSVASLVIGALDGIMLQWMMQRDLFDVTSLIESTINIFLNGIMK